MNALIILGSRNMRGQTAQAAAALAEGLAASGADVEQHFLTHGRIELCRQCDDAGWGICRGEGRCVIEDDFHGLVEKIAAADLVAFATPVYWADLSESLRAFLDRLRRTTVHEAGKARLAGKASLGICVAGGGGGGAPNCCVMLERILNLCGFDVLDMWPVRRQNLPLKCDLLRQAGRRLAT